jgi:hypothetical protein
MDSLQKCHVGVENVVYELSNLDVDEGAEHTMFIQEKLEELYKCEKHMQVFSRLNPHWNYLSPQLLFHLIDTFLTGTKAMKEKESYEAHLSQFRHQTLLSRFCEASNGGTDPPPEGFCDVVAKFETFTGEITLQRIDEFRKTCVNHHQLRLRDFALMLRANVKRDSFLISFMIPKSIVALLRNNFPEDILKEFAITELVIDADCVYRDTGVPPTVASLTAAVPSMFVVPPMLSIASKPTLSSPATTVPHSILGIKDKFKVKAKLSALAHKWADIGKALGIYPDRIKQHSSLDDVLEDWLKQAHYNTDEHGLPTWETLAKAIRDPNGGNDPALADKIFHKVSIQRKRPARHVPVPSSKPQSKGTDYVVQPQSPAEDVDFVEAPEPSSPGPSAEKVDLENYRGLALIVTCDYGGELPGANRDGEEMYKTLHDHFGYNVHYLKNEQATRKAILEKLKEIEHYLTRCGKLKPTTTNGRRKAIVFAFAGHGNNKDGCDYIKTYNGGEVMVMEDIVGAFLNPRTKDVLPIPKLFFIDTCRGGQQLAAINRNSESTEVNYRMDYSTIPDHVAPAASRWTPLIAQKLRQHDISLADVMAKVNQQVYEESGRAPRQADTADRLVTGPLFLWHDKTKRQ